MPTTYMGGKVDVSLNGVTIDSQYLSDDGVVTTLTEAIREIKTLAGTFNQPTGVYEEATSKFSVVLPNMNYLKNIFPDLYQASVDRPASAGQVSFGGDDCTVRENTPVVIHYSCDDNSDNDVFIPNGAVTASIELTQNTSDPVTVEVTVNAQPSDAHSGKIAILGTGSLDEPTLWDPVSEEYEPVASS